MKQYFILFLLAFMFAGCSNMTFNATMCDQIASEPGATMPKECMQYVEEDAQKAFDKPKTKVENKENVIEFTKDKDSK
ncbi:MAG TPA: hypothetical protein CFH84_03790 [Sulfurimonas sp. UBA12504]|nr:MAG: hypothetical protein A2019_02995 [Sulfurimonas sp. GWF2_37_8]DAB30476.1 MAG TPA: hypothetical protein CFH84_03790 [Sulfurimonas sp. UBA12504]